MRVQGRKIILASVVLSGSAVIMAPFCGWIFACGCSWLWTTAGQLCNVHQTTSLHCPWCSHGTLGMIAPLVGFFVGGFFSGVLALRTWGSLPLALGISLIALLPIGVFMGWITVLLTHYPHFL
jgi:hypothetical protein